MTADRLFGVLVTYRRPEGLRGALASIAGQHRPPDRLVCIDNAPTAEARASVEAVPGATYVAMPENVGPAGGFARGMELALAEADDRDWVVLFDDDDPVGDATYVGRVLERAQARRADDERLGGAGMFGSRYVATAGLTRRVPASEPGAEVEVDWLANSWVPVWSVACLRDVGAYDASLFFGLEELEFGLRARQHGWRVVMLRDLLAEERERRGSRPPAGPSRRPGPWRRYYSNRNAVIVATRYGTGLARWRTAVRRFAQSLRSVVRRRSFDALGSEWLGLWHGLRGVGGRVVEPQPSRDARSKRSR